jgi:hypothetical protein
MDSKMNSTVPQLRLPAQTAPIDRTLIGSASAVGIGEQIVPAALPWPDGDICDSFPWLCPDRPGRPPPFL